ncbi:MAG: hypothetical protein CMK92_04765 [Pseudomonas sp.]|nr:hypothetical protein [Pseudomonas sp.]|tara:strand:- start:720 stop:1082 length:363 start_codon:yes stop_codon:yes gene_type:complete
MSEVLNSDGEWTGVISGKLVGPYVNKKSGKVTGFFIRPGKTRQERRFKQLLVVIRVSSIWDDLERKFGVETMVYMPVIEHEYSPGKSNLLLTKAGAKKASSKPIAEKVKSTIVACNGLVM